MGFFIQSMPPEVITIVDHMASSNKEFMSKDTKQLYVTCLAYIKTHCHMAQL